MSSFRSTACCGVQELAYISHGDAKTGGKWDPKKMLGEPFRYAKTIPRAGWLMFTEAGTGKYGHVLMDYIHQEKLGTVTVSKDVKNPNHPRRKTGVRVFLWAVDRPRFQKWVNKNVEVSPNAYYRAYY